MTDGRDRIRSRGFSTATKVVCSVCDRSYVIDVRHVGKMKCPHCGGVERVRR